ncbi:hypothetical protein ACSBR1_007645 [Camellia fascicularis]
MYSDQQSHGSVVGNSENEAVCDSSEGDTQIRNDFLLYWICISFSQSEASGVDGRRTGTRLGTILDNCLILFVRKFQKAQRLAAERETTYAPFVPKEVLLPSNNGNELEIDSAKSHEQLALLVQSKRQEVAMLENDIVFN